jgi:hypothetical protein
MLTTSGAVLVYLQEKMMQLSDENVCRLSYSPELCSCVANIFIAAEARALIGLSTLAHVLTVSIKKSTLNYFQNLKNIHDFSKFSFRGTLRVIELYLFTKQVSNAIAFGENNDWYTDPSVRRTIKAEVSVEIADLVGLIAKVLESQL